MTIRNLDYLYRPRSVAVIGASTQPGTIGAVLLRNLDAGGFEGPILPVNPRHAEVGGRPAYPSIESLPEVPDLAVIATPPDTVPGLVAELVGKGVKAAVVITAGFAERTDDHARSLQQQMLEAARKGTLRIVGPNCLGILVPGVRLNASFAHLTPKPGHLAFVTQSGAVVASVLDWAEPRGIGFSHLISLGDMADVDFGDMLDYLANDRETHSILLYIEAVTHARKFMSAARAASRMKPVIVVKAGRHAEAARAATSHTGALAGSDEVYDTAFRRAGMLRVSGLDELFTAAETLAFDRRPPGGRVAIITNGGGIGVLATDAVLDYGGTIAELDAQTLTKLDRVLPATWSHANPVDIIGDADGARYRAALGVLLEDPGIDAVLALYCPTAITSAREAAEAVIEVVAPRSAKCVVTSWVGGGTTEPARRLFEAHGIPTFDTPALAAQGLMYMVEYARRQAALLETPPSTPEDFTPDVEAARRLVADTLREGRGWLTGPEARALLTAYGVSVVQARVAPDPAAAAALAADIGTAVALKIRSPDIVHKTDVGGVVLDLLGPRAVEEAARAMGEAIARARPDARLEGFTVEPMVHRPGAHELIVGMYADHQFGPVILFGQGGTAVEVLGDKALALPPLNMRLAREVVDRTRVGRLLRGYRELPGADLDAVAMTLMRVAQLVSDLAEIVELDVNPLLADSYGTIALDVRVRLEPSSRPPAERLCIRPYPRELEMDVPLADGRALCLRPIRPEDEGPLRAWFTRLSPEDVRLRFFAPKKTLSHLQAARFTQLDYDREMAFALVDRGAAGQVPIHGVVRLACDPNNERGEYAILLTREMTGMGLGVFLMRRIIDYARGRGLREIYGDVLRENRTMLRLCEAMGFIVSSVPGDVNLAQVTLAL